jgi:hypothetical protein
MFLFILFFSPHCPALLLQQQFAEPQQLQPV